MKLTRRFLTVVIAVLLVVSLSVTSFAADFDAASSKDIVDAFAYDGEDSEVVIVMKDNITMLEALTGKVGKTYTINGNDYVLTNVVLLGDGTVEINANVKDDDTSDMALYVQDNVTATVNGNITSNDYGVYAGGESNVNINGDITATYEAGIWAEGNSTVNVTGDVTAGDYGVYAIDGAEVTVTGDVTAGDCGIYAESYDDSEDGRVSVTVNGDVMTEDSYGYETYSGDCIEAISADVTVNGNVTAGSGSLSDEDLQYPDAYSDGGDGILASGDANVTVSGDVTAGDAQGTYGWAGTAIQAYEESTVTVGGNAAGGSVTSDPEVEPYKSALGGDGIYMDYSATVSVGGNVTGGSAESAQGSFGGDGIAIVVFKPVEEGGDIPADPGLPVGSVTVGGTVAGGAGDAADGAALYYETGSRYDDPEFDVDAFREENPGAGPMGFINKVIESIVFMNDIGAISDEKMVDFEVEYFRLYANAFGVPFPEDFDPYDSEEVDALTDKIDAAAEKLTSEEYNNAIWSALPETAERVRKLYGESLAEYLSTFKIADVTVWELSDENGPMANSGFGEEAAKVLCAEETDYIIRMEQSEGGTVSVDKETAKEGETVIISATPDKGFKLDQVLVNGTPIQPDANGVYSFVVPKGGAVTVSAVFSKIKEEQKEDPKTNPDSPKTGDSSNPEFYMIVLFGAAALSAALILIRRKNKAC